MIAPLLEFMNCLRFLLRVCPRSLGLHRGSFCHCFLSPVERRGLCRCTSGSAGVARLAPCPICLPSPPARYALGVGERYGGWSASRWHTIPLPRLRPHQRLAPSSSALSHKPISPALSREAPRGSLPAFASSNVVDLRRNRYLLHCREPFASSPISCPHRHGSVFRRTFPSTGSNTDLSCSVELTPIG